MRWAAGSVSMFLGLGFGIPCAFGLRHLAQTGQVWSFMGFPTYGDGPFERIGLATSTPRLVGFLSVCIVEVALAVMLWIGAPHAAALSYALLPFELDFWIGFGLPLGPPLGIARTVLVLLANPSPPRRRRTRAVRGRTPLPADRG
jgi:hypothetical protein